MKRFINIYTFLLCLFLVTSCEDDFLSTNPHDKLSEEIFWKTKEDARLSLVGVYNSLYNSSFALNTTYLSLDGMSDNAYTNNGWEGIASAITNEMDSETKGLVTNFFGSAYKVIASCNYFLENIENINNIEDIVKKQWIAEVLFIRAYCYYHLTEFYGDVPAAYESYEIEDENNLLSRSAKNEVVDKILGDLSIAIQDLPDKGYDDGHIVKYTAMALKAKISMANGDYATAATLTGDIINSGIFSLYPDYEILFLAIGQGNDNHEILFSVRYSTNSVGLQHSGSKLWGWQRGLCTTFDLLDEYEYIGIPDNSDPYLNKDPRMKLTFYLDGDPWPYSGQGYDTFLKAFVPSPLIGSLRKYVEPGKNTVAAANICENDLILLRYADVLLMYAEAKNEESGPDESVVSAINEVRNRVGMPFVVPGTKEQMRDIIKHERRVELAAEGQRWLDLKRWGELEKIGNITGADKIPNDYVFLPHNYLWPIPQDQIDYYKNHGKTLIQNPGY